MLKRKSKKQIQKIAKCNKKNENNCKMKRKQ